MKIIHLLRFLFSMVATVNAETNAKKTARFILGVRFIDQEKYVMRFMLFALGLSVLSGCSGVPYAPKGTTIYKGGYSSEKISEGVYRVRFEGNGYNTMPQVIEYVKRRASEVCAPHGYDADIREYISINHEVGYANGMVYPSTHKFPNAEATVTCKPKT